MTRVRYDLSVEPPPRLTAEDADRLWPVNPLRDGLAHSYYTEIPEPYHVEPYRPNHWAIFVSALTWFLAVLIGLGTVYALLVALLVMA